ncbi:MAG: hypothetical protein LBJ64_10195, partial [Deltaproteobacteria bacterium]|nr:hypothetical protein [Deltaproteobacteria bacterium]
MSIRSVCIFLLFALLSANSVQAQPPPWPSGLKPFPEIAGKEALLDAFSGIPYRADGAVSDEGHWATWNEPEARLSSPGFNCSGYLLEAVRQLTGLNISLSQASRDRDKDSGSDSELGQDWDFGLDLILNLSGQSLDDVLAAAKSKRELNKTGRAEGAGVNINGPEFVNLLNSLEDGAVYLFAVSKPANAFKGGLSYYHVGLIQPEDGDVWIRQSTPRVGVHSLNLNNQAGIDAIRRYFPPIRSAERRMALVKLEPERLKNRLAAPPEGLAPEGAPEESPDGADLGSSQPGTSPAPMT